MEYYIDNRQTEVEITEEMNLLIEKVIMECLKVEQISTEVELSISFVTNSEIKELNRDYRGVDEPTDVLSFPIEDDIIVPLPLLGDIIISMEKTVEQAAEFGHSVDRELGYLIAHSMFHLLGYDHLNDEEKMTMREKEKLVMKNLGIFKV